MLFGISLERMLQEGRANHDAKQQNKPELQ